MRSTLKTSLTLAAMALVFSQAAEAQVGLPHRFTPGTPALAEEVNANFRYVAPRNVVYVSGDGTAQENGAKLLDSVNPAKLTVVGGAPSGSNPYLIKLGPGNFSVSNGIELPDFVHLQGSGKDATKIHSTSPTAILLRRSSVRDLTLTFGQTASGQAAGITVVDNFYSTVSRVQLEGNGAILDGIKAEPSTGRQARIEDSEIFLQATERATGIALSKSGMAVLRNVHVSLRGTAKNMVGLSEAGSISVHADGVKIDLFNSRTSGWESVYGIFTQGTGEKRFTNSQVEASSNEMDVTFALAGSQGGIFMYEGGSLETSFTNWPAMSFTSGTGRFYIAGSRLSNDGYYWESGNPTVKCVYNYRKDFTALANSCQGAPR